MKISNGNWCTNKKVMDLSHLHCPVCDSTYIHQKTVGIYNCDEDSITGLHLEVSDKNFTMDTDMKGNPSPRRQGLSIAFYCEQCDAQSPDDIMPQHILNIFQHKGETYIGWEGK
jgi:hypothetical protein